MDIKRLEGSLNQYIEELGIERSYGYMELGACLPSAEQAKLIGSNHVPLLRQTILWNVNDEPFELTTHYFVGDKFTITQDKITARSTRDDAVGSRAGNRWSSKDFPGRSVGSEWIVLPSFCFR